MSQPLGDMTSEEQELVRRIGRALLGVVPSGWRQVRVEYRAVGKHVEVDVLVTAADGAPRPVPPPGEAVRLFGQLRASMYQAGRGTWLSAVYVIEPPSSYRVEFEPDAEPRWRRVPPPRGFQDELFFFPRRDQWVPAWMRQRAGLPPAPPPDQSTATTPPRGIPRQPPAGEPPLRAEPMRTPRVYDRLDASGRPVVNRAPLPPAEFGRVLTYLESAPVVLAARSYDRDAFAPDEPAEVPMSFRTDGFWVWPGAVGYYLRRHEVPPDPELVAHIRARGFEVPEVDDATKDLAVSTIRGQ